MCSLSPTQGRAVPEWDPGCLPHLALRTWWLLWAGLWGQEASSTWKDTAWHRKVEAQVLCSEVLQCTAQRETGYGEFIRSYEILHLHTLKQWWLTSWTWKTGLHSNSPKPPGFCQETKKKHEQPWNSPERLTPAPQALVPKASAPFPRGKWRPVLIPIWE